MVISKLQSHDTTGGEWRADGQAETLVQRRGQADVSDIEVADVVPSLCAEQTPLG